ncbi:MAG: hypothetical protein WGN25_08795 [Candidatus Electrothrix sp. GW3-4]|uniref:hypothetical protein n=1 Tax=Candidatus Electrothrix sp. GW3-4 TaxID=3126740 RepID=UPI0030CE0038
MYLHITILVAAVFHCGILPFSTSHALAEHIDTKTARDYCTIPLPNPEQLSEDEKEWFTTFQEGTFYVQGWKEITSEILDKITQENEKKKLRRSLDLLGIRIGCEWSKSNDIRKINTDMLEQWGSELQKTAEKNPDELPVVIADIRQKVFNLVE